MKKYLILLIFTSFFISACNLPTASIVSDPTSTPTSTAVLPTEDIQTQVPPTEPLPTPTEEINYIAFVNSEGILLDSYEISYFQYLKALEDGADLPSADTEIQNAVIDDLIKRLLLSQAAREAGFETTDEILAERISDLKEDIGDVDAFEQWLIEMSYTLESFGVELSIEIEAAWQREQIITNVPLNAEQIRARQVHFYDQYLANRAYGQLLAGASFETIASNNDPQGYGYLGWFPRNYLLIPEIEEAAFSLQPGEYSELIHTDAGYFLVEVIELEENRTLHYDARLALQKIALNQWLQDKYSRSDIEIIGN